MFISPFDHGFSVRERSRHFWLGTERAHRRLEKRSELPDSLSAASLCISSAVSIG
jgi:hypothetical protein